MVWQEPILGPEAGFRTRAKMAVAGTAQSPILGLPGQVREGCTADLCDCPLYPGGVEEVLEGAKALIRRAQVPPYDVARRRGEIKNVDRKSTRLNSSHVAISYAVFCLQKKNTHVR